MSFLEYTGLLFVAIALLVWSLNAAVRNFGPGGRARPSSWFK